MRTIIAGGRNITDYRKVIDCIKDSGAVITEVVSGGAKGADAIGEQWADEEDIPVKLFPALWNRLDVPGAVIRHGQFGPYNATAGHDRNRKMAKYADALILVWDGKSRGSKNMLKVAHEYGLTIYNYCNA